MEVPGKLCMQHSHQLLQCCVRQMEAERSHTHISRVLRGFDTENQECLDEVAHSS